jgi:hypothetical protein
MKDTINTSLPARPNYVPEKIETYKPKKHYVRTEKPTPTHGMKVCQVDENHKMTYYKRKTGQIVWTCRDCLNAKRAKRNALIKRTGEFNFPIVKNGFFLGVIEGKFDITPSVVIQKREVATKLSAEEINLLVEVRENAVFKQSAKNVIDKIIAIHK